MFPKTVNELIHCEKILPPFIGEMGYEIRYFVGMVEPYLRSGWKLITNRTAFYPPNTTIFLPDFYDKLKLLKKKYHAQSVTGKVEVDFQKKESPETRKQWQIFFEKELRDLLIPIIDRPGRTLTSLDRQLTAAFRGPDDHFINGYHGLVPSYKPVNFLIGCSVPRHIGIQFRNMIIKDPFRDSKMHDLYPKALELSKEVGLPLIVYGEPDGCVFPNDCIKASEFYTNDLKGLDGDLSCLHNCELMIAPDSGWADLMGWLQIPTIIQSISANYVYFSLLPFKPKMSLFKPNISLLEQFFITKNLPAGSIDFTANPNLASHLINHYFDLKSHFNQ